MHIIYAMGQTGQLDFDIAQTREALPRGARVFATCSGEFVAKTLSDHTFHAMSDGEFYALQAEIRKARHLEAERRQVTRRHLGDRISRWLFGS